MILNDDQPDKNNAVQALIAYTEIPGRDPSDKYICRIRKVGSEEWKYNNYFTVLKINIKILL